MSDLLQSCFSVSRPVIGMLHLPALPGSPGFGGDVDAIRGRLLTDAEALVAGGVHGLMVENFGDCPFYPDNLESARTAYRCRLWHRRTA